MFRALIVVLWAGRIKQGKQLYQVYFKKVLGQGAGQVTLGEGQGAFH
jgi:hypothetical protein